MRMENAIITSTRLGLEDHGIFTAYIMLEGDAWGCGFGGYAFDQPKKDKSGNFICRAGTGYGIEFIRNVLRVAGAENWEELKGKHVRAKFEGLGGGIVEIGHITKNEWFNPKSLPIKGEAS